jgi:long-chain acyl-CoA synthetase
VLPEAARRYGDKCALVSEGRAFSFNDLDEKSSRLANGLIAIGVEAGDRVTIYSQNCWQWIVSYYAAHKIGAVANPINVMLTPDEVAYVVSDCGAKALLATRDKGEPLLGLKDGTSLNEIIIFDSDVPDGARSFDSMLYESSPNLQIGNVPSDALSTICYTSGTTGHPKGAMHSHRNVITNAALTATLTVRTGHDTVVTALPCPHVYGNVVMNTCFIYGMTLVLLPLFDEVKVMSAIEEHKATMFEGVPTMYMYLLAHPDFDNFDLSSLTRCTVGGQTMPAAKAEEFEARVGCPLLELWGMTEIAGVGTVNPWYGENRHGSIGIALPSVECRIADVDEASRTLDANEVGELMIRGPIVMQGYYGNEQATSETIEADGWLHSGDLAKMDEDGYVWIVDRKKDMILTAGYNIYPAELERVIAMHPSVALAAVGSRPDEAKGEIAKAYIVLKPGAEADAESIMALCRKHLAAYKVPRQIQFVDDVPKTSTGKVMRRKLHTLDR